MAFKLPKPDVAALPQDLACPYLKGSIATSTCPHHACSNPNNPSSLHDYTGFTTLTLVGLNHQTADVGLREQMYTDQLEQLMAELRRCGLAEVAVLFTCNRIEVYTAGGHSAAEIVAAHFAQRCNMPVAELQPHLYTANGHDAALHLMRVASGLESLVLGESQILGQVGEAFDRSHRAGMSGPVLNRVLNAALTAGKRARAETDIGRHTLSVSHAGVMLARASRPDIAGANVLVIGAGEMARLAVGALRSHDVSSVRVINRTPNRAAHLAAEFGVGASLWPALRTRLAEADIVISATSATTPIVAASDLPRDGRRRTFIDLGVPRNICPSVSTLPHTDLHDVDGLRQVVEQHRILRQREVVRVEAILGEELGKCLEQLRSQRLAPVITALRATVETLVDAELEKTLAKLPGLDPDSRELLELMAHRIATKILHAPTVALRSPNGPNVAPAICQIFGVDLGQAEP